MSVDVTSEIRWFLDGQLPPPLATWFSPTEVECLIEHRCDTYLVDDRCDTGIKRRFRSKLELKVRTEDPEAIVLDEGFVGRLERWKRWSPADDLVNLAPDASWIDVHKTIIKRRFDADGENVALSHASRAMTGAGCDLEIVALECGERRAWSLAFAAFGPMESHVDSIHAAWRTQCEQRAWPWRSSGVGDISLGYPEWLASMC